MGMLSKKKIEAVFERLAAVNPEPKGELDHVNPYTLLVAVVLSAQATDKGVNKATAALFRKVTTPQQMLDLGEAGLIEHIKTIGLFRAKAKNVISLSRSLIERFGGEVPKTREELESLAGVGRKTANVVLSMAFGIPTIAVDTHVFRVSQRLGLAKGKTPNAIEAQLEKVIPAKFMQHAHHWLILHGRYTCVARKPKCPVCPVNSLCPFPDKTKP
jgi:endonuclease-3